MAGGVVTGLFVPVFLQVMNLLSGDGAQDRADGRRVDRLGPAGEERIR
jgi:hypothetical protein